MSWLVLIVILGVASATKPNIIFFLADDLGWNDVGFHGSNQIPTPNLDSLGVSGLMLHNYYTSPICSPSRAALMTGKYPIHTGMQHGVIYGAEPRGLPLNEKILPQYLKDLGYKTHLVGKWHLGSYKKEYLPLNRGFDSHVGFWTGRIDMYDHTTMEQGSWGTDFRRGFEVAHDLFGVYATDVYTDEAIKVVNSHNKSEPLFLMVAHSAVHSGNPYEPIRAPQKLIDAFKYIDDSARQKFAAVLSKLDESVGKVVKALHTQGLLENSIVVFSTDNGGPAAGFNDNAASNYPLKGVKNTLWEGGVRGAGFLWSPLLDSKARVAYQKMHISDWLPTLYSAAGGDLSVLENLDGVNQWCALSKNTESPRTSVLHNIDDIWGIAALTVDKYKLIKGTIYKGVWDNWYGPSGREGAYNASLLYDSHAGRVLDKLNLMPPKEKVMELRDEATVKCNDSIEVIQCKPREAPCVFNIDEDPCERRNLAQLLPEVLESLLSEMHKLNASAVTPNAQPIDPRGDPQYWGRVYTNFGNYETQHGSSVCL
ncbi:arylsulfatase I [Bombyx mandarina]|uniref:Arylsulfatase I n=1 Tax=Bombyx mandarina TaxID=7092 RepID=A0A6J2JBV4_BOMMA|nr:arylsulfatase I [Bombyx mandarina]